VLLLTGDARTSTVCLAPLGGSVFKVQKSSY
jgi:hypothetical protein